MTTGRRKPAPRSHPAQDSPSGPASDEGLSSEDLFGDLADRPGPGTGAHGARRRKGPIRVRVAEPGRGDKPAAGEALPEDVAALLDAIPAGDGDASTPDATEGKEGGGEALEELLEPSSSTPAQAAPKTPLGADSDGEEELDLDELLPLDSRASSARTPPGRTEAGSSVLLENGSEWLIDDMATPAPAVPKATDYGSEGPPPRPSPTGAQPGASEAAPSSSQDEDLNLAALAADALTPPVPQSEAPASKEQPAPQDEGVQYGRYQLLERVARGGMAEVFKAKRSGIEGFEKILAVKRILPHLSDNKEFVDMFVNEAKMVAGLTHPSIVQILDLGRLETSYYIAMEYVHGRDLRTIQRRAQERELPIPLHLCAQIVSNVCAALEYAHRKKDAEGQPLDIVHRDISPQNILISFEGAVKLTDFGIAKAAAKASTTDKGALRGKLLFMSPEQAWGRPMDRRSDIFSLGIVFYEMLTGEKPFVGGDEMSVLEMVRQCVLRPLRKVRSGVPQALEQVIMKALERDPDDRYQHASDMQRELERILHERQASGTLDLAGFLEVLFDREERGELGPDEVASGDEWIASGLLELDFDTTGGADEDQTAPGVPRDPMSIQRLLRRFENK